MKKSYAASIILGTVCGFMAVITSPLHPIACPFLIKNRDHKNQPLLFSAPAPHRSAGCIPSDT